MFWAWAGILRNSDFPRFQCGAWIGANLWGSENLEFVSGALPKSNCQRNTGVTDGRGAVGRHRLLSEGFFALSGTEVVPVGALDSASFCNSLIIREPVAGIEPATY